VATPRSNPFKAGELVQYTPSQAGLAHSLHTDLNALVPGEHYQVASVFESDYLILVGFEGSPSGGLYWSEFSKLK
jgi:hypothetical protein